MKKEEEKDSAGKKLFPADPCQSRFNHGNSVLHL